MTCPRAGLGGRGTDPFLGPWSWCLVLEGVFSMVALTCSRGLMAALALPALPGIAAGKLPLCCISPGHSLCATLALTFPDDDTAGHLLQSSHLCLTPC